MWSVPPPTVEELKGSSEISTIAYTPALGEAITNLTKAFPDAIFHTLPKGSPKFPKLDDKYTKLAYATDAYLLAALHRARLTKDEYEIAQIRKANEISSRAHEVVMRLLGRAVKGLITKEAGAGVVRPLLPGEWIIEKEAEAEAVFVASCRREGYLFRQPESINIGKN